MKHFEFPFIVSNVKIFEAWEFGIKWSWASCPDGRNLSPLASQFQGGPVAQHALSPL